MDLKHARASVETYYRSGERSKAIRERVKAAREAILKYLVDHEVDGQASLDMPDGSTVFLVTREKKEGTTKEVVESKIKGFFDAHGFDGADALIDAIFTNREVVGTNQTFSRRRPRKARSQGGTPGKKRRTAKKARRPAVTDDDDDDDDEAGDSDAEQEGGAGDETDADGTRAQDDAFEEILRSGSWAV